MTVIDDLHRRDALDKCPFEGSVKIIMPPHALRTHARLIATSVIFTAISSAVFAGLAVFAEVAIADETDRYGPVRGTYEACERPIRALRTHYDEVALTPERERSRAYLARRIIVELDRCLHTTEASPEAYIDVIVRYSDVGLDGRAIDVARDAALRFPGHSEVAFAGARILYRNGKKAEAAAMLENAVARGATLSTSATLLLGAYAYDTGSYDRAVTLLQRARVVDPLSFALNAALGDACLQAGDLPCASQALELAWRVNNTNALLARRIGDLRVSLGDSNGALEAYDEALNR
ncbi:MAG: tetratricopeptide repeat protein [Clostridia bacterium]|nr:tetratricopeptide repeat protein [Deltaproteobacteria bacterium]